MNKSILRFAVACALINGSVRAQPVVITDIDGDAEIRRTDIGNNDIVDPLNHRLPDLIEIRLGKFSPIAPATDLFLGDWNPTGGFLRVELIYSSLVNPPGPLGFDGSFPQYDPYRHGPNPVFGFVEFDSDADENTGGELDAPEYRYLGVAGRWGGLPSELRFLGRAARSAYDFDFDILTTPFVDRSGEEFHLALLGEMLMQVVVRSERPGGNPGQFEADETWEIRGRFFHRSHGWESFILTCPLRQGVYEPVVSLLFQHSAATDRTTVSLVYPLTNADAAQMFAPPASPQANNGCDTDLNSIGEALADLKFSAEFADSNDRLLPEFQLIAGWEFKTPSSHLDPTLWRVCANVGTAYQSQPLDGTPFVWTDVTPEPRIGDFDGSGAVDAVDGALLQTFIASFDGNPLYDLDGNSLNGSLLWPQHADNFSTFDTNYDGIVNTADRVRLGDMNLDQLITVEDMGDMAQALLDPASYRASHGNANPRARGDLNGDRVLDGRDLQLFVNLVLSGL